MDHQDIFQVYTSTMSPVDFVRLSSYITETFGITVAESKKAMLESRLRKRLKALCMTSFSDYCDHVLSPDGLDEVVYMMDVVTTNKTDFFRESSHFEFLAREALPTLFASKTGQGREVILWSAGCSTGEEPYTLSMVMSEFARYNPGFRFMILATDLSTRVLDVARRAIYTVEQAAPIPPEFRRNYIMRGTGERDGMVRIVPELRNLVRFRRLNLMEDDFGFREPLDIIFCRNVVIYFDRATQERLVQRFAQLLRPGGYLFMGHSETLNGMRVGLTQVVPTVYRK